MFCKYLSHSAQAWSHDNPALGPGATCSLLCSVPFPQQKNLSSFQVSPGLLPLPGLRALL